MAAAATSATAVLPRSCFLAACSKQRKSLSTIGLAIRKKDGFHGTDKQRRMGSKEPISRGGRPAQSREQRTSQGLQEDRRLKAWGLQACSSTLQACGSKLQTSSLMQVPRPAPCKASTPAARRLIGPEQTAGGRAKRGELPAALASAVERLYEDGH